MNRKIRLQDFPKGLRVAHIVHSLGPGGLERRLQRLVVALESKGVQIWIFVLRPGVEKELEFSKSVCIEYFKPSKGLVWGNIWEIAKTLKREKIHIVHTHNWVTQVEGVLAGIISGTPVRLHGEHDGLFFDPSEVKPLRAWVQKILLRCTTKVISVNTSIASDAQKVWKCKEDKIAVIPNGVDLKRFNVVNWQGPENGLPWVLGSVGRLDPIKDFKTCIQALEFIPHKSELCLVGDGPEREKLKYFARSCSNKLNSQQNDSTVSFTGSTQHPEEWYMRFHLYINSSVSEGMSNTLLEAMACGLPIVCSRIAGNTEWLREKENALFFKPGNAQELASCCQYLIEHPAEARAMGLRNRQKVEENYSNISFINRYTDLYRELCIEKSVIHPLLF